MCMSLGAMLRCLCQPCLHVGVSVVVLITRLRVGVEVKVHEEGVPDMILTLGCTIFAGALCTSEAPKPGNAAEELLPKSQLGASPGTVSQLGGAKKS